MRHYLDPKFTGRQHACVICGREVKDESAKIVYLGEGCFDAITKDEPDFDGLSARVGSDCEKLIPSEFLFPAKEQKQ